MIKRYDTDLDGFRKHNKINPSVLKGGLTTAVGDILLRIEYTLIIAGEKHAYI